MDSFPERRPIYGWFDDRAEVIASEIKDAASYGIQFFAFLWYYPKAMTPEENRLNYPLEYYLKQPLSVRRKLKFIIVYTNHDQWDIPPGDDWDHYSEKWMEIMSDPGYLRVAVRKGGDKKPLLIIWSPQRFHDHWEGQFGKGAAYKALQAFKMKAVKKGLPGLFIGGCSDQASNSLLFENDRYDFITGYNYNLGFQYPGGSKQNYESLVKGNIERWNQEISWNKKPYIPTITSGWDPRPILYMASVYPTFIDRTSNKFETFCLKAKTWVKTNRNRSTDPPIIMIYAWNELSEGGYILPTDGDGYSFLKALKKVFRSPQNNP